MPLCEMTPEIASSLVGLATTICGGAAMAARMC
jgi:uncharacterized membrane protein YadS